MTATDSKDDAKQDRPIRWLRALLVVSAAILLLGVFLWWRAQPTSADLVKAARKSLRLSRYSQALTEAEEAIRMGEDTPAMHLLAGESALRLGEVDNALQHFDRIKDTAGKDAQAARMSSASILIHQHQIGLAEEQLRRALSLAPQDDNSHRLLSECLGLQGRRKESVPHLLHGVDAGDIDLQSLCYLADTERTVELSEEQLAAFLNSKNAKSLLGAACVAISYREFEKGEELLRKSLAAAPDLVEAHVRLGTKLLSANDSAVMLQWEENLPSAADTFSGTWFVRSQWCFSLKRYEQAAACLWRALQIDADNAAANHQMAQVLTVLDRVEEAVPFRERGRKLTRLATLANEIYMGDSRSAPLKEAAELVESLGRISEAIGWAVAAQYENPNESWPLAMQQRLTQNAGQSGAANSTPPSVQRPADALDFSAVAWLPPEAGSSIVARETSENVTVSFRDVTADVGIDFLYENAEDPTTDGRLMFEYTGGGVGVLDFDHDGWPDLYFTQAGDAPPADSQKQAVDRLYRNQEGDGFADVTGVAGVKDYGFGQGVSAGDINNDGFADLYVANINGNRLYLNNGDGTFADVTQESGVGHSRWTTSVAIADLDGDANPDLYDVTFLIGDDVFERICEEDGVARSCAPAGFAAAEDVVFRNSGHGSFQDVSESIGIHAPDGDGLGILVADFAGDGRPSIFIANDGRANFYFRRDTSVAESVKFSEEALTRGLAFDRDGRAQACMGIASSDFNGDGTWDLFVTNFFNESNTFYSQFGGENFGDSSQSAGIREPSLVMLGFGTQAIDGDLDGWEDVLVGNGHVDNFEHKDVPYRMPLEYFRNRQGAGFEKVSLSESGGIMSQPMLSRSMAVIDWNGDGRAEAAISRLEDPALLLVNATEDAGQFLAIQVVGGDSARDAVGTRITATVDGRQILRQVTAGDGYQSSNQKQLIFGLGQGKVVEKLEVTWPGGLSQTYSNLAAGQKVILREGDATPWQIAVD